MTENVTIGYMCGRYTFAPSTETWTYFGVPPFEAEPRYNVTPGSFQPVIVNRGQGREVASMKWGLIPSWAKDPKIGFRMINARAEGLPDKPSFRSPFKRHRCIVPINGFFEWQKLEKVKQPWYMHAATDAPLGLAGLYDTWKDAEARDLATFTIITVPANQTLQPIHDRMPAILRPPDYDTWLDTQENSPTLLLSLLKPADPSILTRHQVSTAINTATAQGPELIKVSEINSL